MSIEYYLKAPWTVRVEHHDDDGPYISMTVEELPGFVVAGRSHAAIEQEFWPALQDFLSSYLEDGEEPPLPVGYRDTAPKIPSEVRMEVELFEERETESEAEFVFEQRESWSPAEV